MPEKINFEVNQEGKYDGEVIKRVSQSEIDDWKKLYPHINVRKTLDLVKELGQMNVGNGTIIRDGKEVEYDGRTSFWGSKRVIMMIFDNNRENNEVFEHFPQEIQDKIRGINIDDYIKSS